MNSNSFKSAKPSLEVESYVAKFRSSGAGSDFCTPTIEAANLILNKKIDSFSDMMEAAQQLLAYGYKNVLIQGNNFQQQGLSYDYWTDGTEAFWLTSLISDNKAYTETSNLFSLITNHLMRLNYGFKDALVITRMYLNRSARLPFNERSEDIFLIEESWPEDGSDLPYLSSYPLEKLPLPFPACGREPLGLYPVVDSSEWLELLLPEGVKTIQLRIKNKLGLELEAEIKKSVHLAEKFNARLFINDYWELALAHKAYGVHLGQEDLLEANLAKLYQAGLRLGISSYCYYDVARAHALNPSYIACGPIFPTTSKEIAIMPQGLFKLERWCRTLKNYPLVAIGGINASRITSVMATGVDGVALITAITEAAYPAQQTKALLKLIS